MDPMLQDPLMPRLLIAGVLFHLATARMSTGFYYPDEHFQILEFAGLKLGFNQPGDLAWEYAAHIRPNLQPWLAYTAISGLDQIGLTEPFAQARVLRFLSADLSSISLLLLMRREPLKILPPMLAGGPFVLACGVLLDRAFYGDWVFAPWSYLQANLIEGRPAAFGTLPWWGYFKLMVSLHACCSGP